MMNNLAAAAKAIGLAIIPVEARTPAEIDTALSHLSSEHVDAFMLISDSLFNSYRVRIGELAMRAAIWPGLPCLSVHRRWQATKCPSALGFSLGTSFRQSGNFAIGHLVWK